MKKILTVLVLAVLMLAACGNAIPKDMDKTTYERGKDALEIMDSYNKGKLSRDEANDRLNSIYKALDKLEFDEDHFYEDNKNLGVKITIMSFQYAMFNKGDTYSVADELRHDLELD